jgi:hypothetical protein
VIVRHHSPPTIRAASALPASNQALPAERGPVTAKKPTSRSATTAPVMVQGREGLAAASATGSPAFS